MSLVLTTACFFLQSTYSRCVRLSEGAYGSRLHFNIQRGYVCLDSSSSSCWL